MDNNLFYNWKCGIRPDNFPDVGVNSLGAGSFAAGCTNKGRIRHQAFTIGFFGFHYIRAANENEPAMRKESLQILRKLVLACDLDTHFLHGLNASRQQKYSDFWENVLRKISLALGDSQGQDVQKMAEFGFWLTAAYACFVGALKDKDTGQTTGHLRILEAWMPDLLTFARQAGIPDMLHQSLAELTYLLPRSKTHPTAYKCRRILEAALRDLLLKRH